MTRIDAIAQLPAVREALQRLPQQLDNILTEIVGIQQVPSPTFAEKERAEFIAARFAALGLETELDPLCNVYARVPGAAPGGRPPLVVSAHLDTVFPRETDLAIRREDHLLYGPGIGDNSTGLGGLLALAGFLQRDGLRPAADVWLVANVGEEGLGDLRGMRAVVDRFGEGARYLVLEGGLYGQLTHQAVGVRRYRLDVEGPGGHSWGNFGVTSAIHVLGSLIASIDKLEVPESPKTTYNVGIVEGGLSINSIARSACLWLDLRSESMSELQTLVERVERIAAAEARRRSRPENGVRIHMEQVGDRPSGSIPRDTPLVVWAEQALHHVGCSDVKYIVSSTDANIPLSRGYEAVCLGLTHSANSHRPDEYIDTTFLPQGLSQLILVTLAAAGIQDNGHGLSTD